MATNPPAGFHSITPYLVVDGAEKAIEFYKRAFDAQAVDVAKGPDGKVMNAQIKIGDSMLMLNDEFPDYGAVGPLKMGGTPVTIHLYVPDADATWQKALDAGAQVGMPIADQFWGDRYGMIIDPFGHKWGIATRVRDVTPDDIAEAMSSAH